MNIDELKLIMKENGIVGAGGAGFPSYAKLDKRADTIILNCAECEPLLKLHRQVIEKYAYEIITTLDEIAEIIEAREVIIAIKPSYKSAVAQVEGVIKTITTNRTIRIGALPEVYPAGDEVVTIYETTGKVVPPGSIPISIGVIKTITTNRTIRIGALPEVYPAGDEVVTIYETTGKVVPPGSIPISIGIIVFNVETILNVYRAIHEKEPVTYKYITITGEVKNPVTLKVPIGITVDECVKAAGGLTIEDPVYINGGPMTGSIVNGYDTITKTSNAILVMPPDQYIIRKRQSKISIDMKRAMASCCQCEMCTDLCPRNLLGHPIRPHAFMRASTSGATKEVNTFMETFYCSQCGLCEMYACFQDLSPKTLIGECKDGLRKNGVKPPKEVKQKEVSTTRAYRGVSKERLTARLGLEKYDAKAPLVEELVETDLVKIVKQKEVSTTRAYRGVSKERLTARLGLEKYDAKAPLVEELVETDLVKISMRQHIGAPATPCVAQGDSIECGNVIAAVSAESLGASIHASISGTVLDVNNDYVTIRRG